MRMLLTTVSALMLSACAVGPDYSRPTPPAASSGPFLSAREGVTTTAPAPNDADPEWWRLYKDPVLDGLGPGTHAYFVHSYHFRTSEPAHRLAVTDYGGPLAAVIGRDNLIGTQFHPEKSQRLGLRLIGNFLGWRP